MQDRYLRPGKEFAIAHLVEECGEVLMAAGKAQRFGLASFNPEVAPCHRESNQDWLLRELLDLEGAIARVRKELGA